MGVSVRASRLMCVRRGAWREAEGGVRAELAGPCRVVDTTACAIWTIELEIQVHLSVAHGVWRVVLPRLFSGGGAARGVRSTENPDRPGATRPDDDERSHTPRPRNSEKTREEMSCPVVFATRDERYDDN